MTSEGEVRISQEKPSTEEGGEKKRKTGFGFPSKNEQKRRKLDLLPGAKGIIVTGGRPREMLREAMNILRRVVNESGTAANTKGSEKASDADEVTDELENEVAALNNEVKRFVPLRDVFKGVSFIRFHNPSDSPSEIVHSILSEAHDNKTYYSRFLNRLIPLDVTCKPFKDDFQKTAEKLIAKAFPKSAADKGQSVEKGDETVTNGSIEGKGTWCCQFSSRNTKTLGKEDVLDVLTKAVGTENYKVKLSDADRTIIVEVNQLICGISVVRDYNKLAKFNLYRLSHPEDEEEEEGKKGGGNHAAEKEVEKVDKPEEDEDKVDKADGDEDKVDKPEEDQDKVDKPEEDEDKVDKPEEDEDKVDKADRDEDKVDRAEK